MVRSVRLRRSTVARLNAAAAAAGVGPTELMRRWIEERLEVGESPVEAKVRLALLRSMADALVREIGIPGITVSIVTAEPPKPRRSSQPRKRS